MKNCVVFSRGEFAQLSAKDKENKYIIRLHNATDKGFFKEEEPFSLILFFEDIHAKNIPLLEKWRAKYTRSNSKYFTHLQAKKLVEFIKLYKNQDFIIHCEYGKSRSAAVALFLHLQCGYNVLNKTKEQLTKHNDWVLNLLEREIK